MADWVRPTMSAAAENAVGDEIEDILPHQGVSAGEDQIGERLSEAGDLIQKGKALLPGELAGIRLRLSLGPAVLAGEQAGPGYLPDDDEGSLSKVKGRHAFKLPFQS